MSRRRAYIAAPWWDPDIAIREWHTRRAELLGRLAKHDGYEAVVVHRALMDAGMDDGADPEAREAGLQRTCQTVREIAAEGGAIYGLTNDACRLTSGTRREFDAWWDVPHVEGARCRRSRWQGFRWEMERAGLGTEWAALRVRPC